MVEVLSVGSVVRLRNKETQEYGEYFVIDMDGAFVELIPLEPQSMSIVLSHETMRAIYEPVAFAEIEWNDEEE